MGGAITRQERQKLQNAEVIICSDNSRVPKHVAGSVHEIDQVLFHQISCELRDEWNKQLMSFAGEVPAVLFTMGGASRSENSDIIRCLCLLTYAERQFPLGHISFVGARNATRWLTSIGATFSVRRFLTVARCGLLSVLKTVWHLFRALMIWCCCRDIVNRTTSSRLVLSLSKHFGDGGDKYYGTYFNDKSNSDRVILTGSLGGLQSGSARSQAQICRRFCNLENLSVLTDGASPIRLFSLAWGSLRFMLGVIFWRNDKSQISSSPNLRIMRLLRLEIINTLHHYVSHAQLHYKLVNRSVMEDRRKVLTYHFEFPMGRVIAAAAHERSSGKVFGLQHGLISRGKWCYGLVGEMFRSTEFSNLTPDIFLLESEPARHIIGLPKSDVELVGAVRYDRPIKLKRTSYFHGRKPVVFILLDLHADLDDLQGMLSLANRACAGAKIRMRFHPRSIHAQAFRDYIASELGDEEPSISEGKLEEELETFRPSLVIGQSSSALIECFFAGFPISVYRNVCNRMILDWFIDANIESSNASIKVKIDEDLEEIISLFIAFNDGLASRRIAKCFT
jgi:hypothetical protein